MKILLINVVSKSGSTGAICSSLFDYYKSKGHDVYFAYGRGKKTKDKFLYKFCFELESKFWHFLSFFTGNLYGGMPFSTLRLKKFIKRIDPDVINIHCINGFCVNIYSLLAFLKKNGRKVYITHHAEFLYTGTCGYSLDCNGFKKQCESCPLNFKNVHKNFLKMCKTFDNSSFKHICVSPWVEERLKESAMLKSPYAVTILNPIKTFPITKNPYFEYQGKIIILYVASQLNNPEKGANQIYQIAKNVSDYEFFVIGDHEKENKDNIHFVGRVSKEEISNFYANANCSIILSKKETFSMVVGESLMYGTPVIGFKAGGPETISVSEFSTFVNQCDLKGFCDELKKLVSKDISRQEIISQSRQKYSLEIIGEQYLTEYAK